MSKQFYGIKYPISEESDSLTFFDLNESKFESAKSMLLHIILTPKGQRLRHPNFGTNLIKFIFEQNDSQTWDSIKEDIRKQVGLYLSEVHFDDIQIIKNENDNSILLEIDYSVSYNGDSKQNKTIVKL
jgi:phage baseplate assembly protein W